MGLVFDEQKKMQFGNATPGIHRCGIADLLAYLFLENLAAAIIDNTKPFAIVQRTIDTNSVPGALSPGQVLAYNTAESKLEKYSETAVTNEAIGTGDDNQTTWEGMLSVTNQQGVVRGSFNIKVATVSKFTDDKFKRLVPVTPGDGGGPCDYNGYLRVIFTTPPAAAAAITANYTRKSGVPVGILLQSIPTGTASFTAYVLIAGVVKADALTGWTSDVARDLRNRIIPQS